MSRDIGAKILFVFTALFLLGTFGVGLFAAICNGQREQDKRWSANAAARAACIDMGGLALPATGEVTQCVLPCARRAEEVP